ENPPAWDGSQPLRFRSDPKDRIWQDAVMGDMHAGAEANDDFVLIKSDGYPTYNFAHIVDDAEMNISHVIRSQEFVSSTPRFLDLYEALGLEKPILATLPFVMAIDGKKKLSKRDGAKDVLDYAKEGVLPETMLNFLSSMGWNDGTEQEIFSPEELIQKFDLSRVQKSPARFDEQRLLWMNGMHIRALTPDTLLKLCEDHWPEEAKPADEDYKKQVLVLVQERLKLLGELKELTWFFFTEPKADKTLADLLLAETKLDSERAGELLAEATKAIESCDFEVEKLHDAFYALAEKLGTKPGEFFKLIRIALVGGTVAPGLFETMVILSKETVVKRLKAVKESL
ncbi:MAG: glutamate--tRNA ligase family protein, partial [Patescibacteria group bacterium]